MRRPSLRTRYLAIVALVLLATRPTDIGHATPGRGTGYTLERDCALYFEFLGRTGAGLGSVLIDSQPLLVALLARSLFGEAINPVGWLGLLLGLLGILCLGLPPELLRHSWLEGPSALGVRA